MTSALTKLGDVVSQILTRERVCEACGNEFSCGATSLRGCWCSEITLSETARSDLRKAYRDCLCRACLEKISAKESQEEI